MPDNGRKTKNDGQIAKRAFMKFAREERTSIVKSLPEAEAEDLNKLSSDEYKEQIASMLKGRFQSLAKSDKEHYFREAAADVKRETIKRHTIETQRRSKKSTLSAKSSPGGGNNTKVSKQKTSERSSTAAEKQRAKKTAEPRVRKINNEPAKDNRPSKKVKDSGQSEENTRNAQQEVETETEKQETREPISIMDGVSRLLTWLLTLGIAFAISYTTLFGLINHGDVMTPPIVSLDGLTATSAAEFCTANKLSIPLPQTLSQNKELQLQLNRFFYQTGAQYFWLRALTSDNGQLIDSGLSRELNMTWIPWGNAAQPDQVIGIDHSGTWHHLSVTTITYVVCV